MHTQFPYENLKERTHLEEIDIDGRRILKYLTKKLIVKAYALD
jgi:hypothetical protein